jgi:hypothetical protein
MSESEPFVEVADGVIVVRGESLGSEIYHPDLSIGDYTLRAALHSESGPTQTPKLPFTEEQ